MIRLSPFVPLGFLLLAGCATNDRPAAAENRVESYRSCLLGERFANGSLAPGPEPRLRFFFEQAPDDVLIRTAWSPVASDILAHRALWLRQGGPLPFGRSQVWIYSRSRHWVAADVSYVATRETDGLWRVDVSQQLNVGTGSVFGEARRRWLSPAEAEP